MSYHDHEVLKQIGTGGYSNTFLVKNKYTAEIAAMKIVSLN